MKLFSAVLFAVLSIIVQVSFVRISDWSLFTPNLSLVVLFLLCYFLSFEKMIKLALITGIMIDVNSSVSFGSTALAALGACSMSFYIRENILKGGSFTDFLLNILMAFILFYFLLGISNILLRSSSEYMSVFNLINVNLAGEILINLILSSVGYNLMKYYYNNKIYGFIRDIKISS